jgi:hypothetical protein
MVKFPLPLDVFCIGDNEDRLLHWLATNIDSNITIVEETYELPYWHSDVVGRQIPKDDQSWEAIWYSEIKGMYELRTKKVTPSWEWVNRFHVDAGEHCRTQTTWETYFVIYDESIALQFKLILYP